jgi:hypothetical protein
MRVFLFLWVARSALSPIPTIYCDGNNLRQDKTVAANEGRDPAQGVQFEVFSVHVGRPDFDKLEVEMIFSGNCKQHDGTGIALLASEIRQVQCNDIGIMNLTSNP